MLNTTTHQARELALNIQRSNYKQGHITLKELQDFYHKHFIFPNHKHYENNPT